MGMYNEVFKKCPKCSNRCEIQVAELVMGFGGFNLDDPESLSEQLNEDQMVTLAKWVKDEIFYCDQCSHSFTLESTRNKRVELAKKLFSSNTEDSE